MNEIEKANAYREMLNSFAWKDFEMFLESERILALESAIISDEIKDIQLNRGKVKAFDTIKSHLGYILGQAGNR